MVDRTGKRRRKIPFAEFFSVSLVLSLALALCASVLFSADTNALLYDEQGVVESATLAFYLLAAGLFFFAPYRNPSHKWIPGLICLIFAAREHDLHETISESGFPFFRVSFKNEYPVAHIAFEGIVVLVTAVLFVWMLHAYRRRSVAVERRWARDEKLMIGGWLIVPAVIVLDGLANKILSISGFSIGLQAAELSVRLEETLECMIPLAFLLGVLEFWINETDFYGAPFAESSSDSELLPRTTPEQETDR